MFKLVLILYFSFNLYLFSTIIEIKDICRYFGTSSVYESVLSSFAFGNIYPYLSRFLRSFTFGNTERII